MIKYLLVMPLLACLVLLSGCYFYEDGYYVEGSSKEYIIVEDGPSHHRPRAHYRPHNPPPKVKHHKPTPSKYHPPKKNSPKFSPKKNRPPQVRKPAKNNAPKAKGPSKSNRPKRK